MQFERYANRMQFLKELIQKQGTGTPKELAGRLGISERMLYHYLKDLKINHKPIKFDRKKNSFFFIP